MTQIKEFLRRGLFTVIVLCSAAACSNNDENEDTNYTLDSIQWAMLNDDKVEETVINIMPEIYENASSWGRKVNCVMRCFSFKLIGRGSASAK
ncbi:hypothetical protein, partial [Bacteroides cellulosilyticus]